LKRNGKRGSPREGTPRRPSSAGGEQHRGVRGKVVGVVGRVRDLLWSSVEVIAVEVCLEDIGVRAVGADTSAQFFAATRLAEEDPWLMVALGARGWQRTACVVACRWAARKEREQRREQSTEHNGFMEEEKGFSSSFGRGNERIREWWHACEVATETRVAAMLSGSCPVGTVGMARSGF
jgi:hypothetical protein